MKSRGGEGFMRQKPHSFGYTIVEVMIVLAVTGSLFVGVSFLLSGRQAATELDQGVRGLESQIQTVASDVVNGFYPTGFKCTAPSSGTVGVTGSTGTPGGNTGCIFLGKVMNFREGGVDFINIVGRQYKAGTADITSLNEALPIVVDNGTISVTQKNDYQYGLKTTKIIGVGSATAYKALAFVVPIGGSSTTSNSSASLNLLLYGVTGDASNVAGAADSSILTVAGAPTSNSLVAVPAGARICLLGGNGRKGEIIIGSSGNQTGTNVLLDQGVGTDCD
jgi:hypothetical protein